MLQKVKQSESPGEGFERVGEHLTAFAPAQKDELLSLLGSLHEVAPEPLQLRNSTAEKLASH